jgi:hypothetical protein
MCAALLGACGGSEPVATPPPTTPVATTPTTATTAPPVETTPTVPTETTPVDPATTDTGTGDDGVVLGQPSAEAVEGVSTMYSQMRQAMYDGQFAQACVNYAEKYRNSAQFTQRIKPASQSTKPTGNSACEKALSSQVSGRSNPYERLDISVFEVAPIGEGGATASGTFSTNGNAVTPFTAELEWDGTAWVVTHQTVPIV